VSAQRNRTPNVRIEAVRADGSRSVTRTDIVSNDNTPAWNKRYQFLPGCYMFYRISVLDSDDLSADEVIIYDQLVTVRPGTMNKVLCASPGNCDHALTFKSDFIPTATISIQICAKAEELAVDNILDLRSEYARGWFGRNCELPYGEMTVEVVKGHNLPDRDSLFAGKSNPYVEVRAFNANGYSVAYLTSATIWGNHNPVWNYERSLGTKTFSGKIELTVMDEATTSADGTLIPRNTLT